MDDPVLSWRVEDFVFSLKQIVFECDVNTTGLDPDQDILDVTFKLGQTVMKAYTNIPYDDLPAKLGGFGNFPYEYKAETRSRKLAYNNMVRTLIIY